MLVISAQGLIVQPCGGMCLVKWELFCVFYACETGVIIFILLLFLTKILPVKGVY